MAGEHDASEIDFKKRVRFTPVSKHLDDSIRQPFLLTVSERKRV